MSVEIFACFLSAIRGSCGTNIQVMYLHIRTPNFRTSTLLLPAVSASCFILIYALRQSRLLLAHFLHKNARILLLIAIMRTSCVSRWYFRTHARETSINFMFVHKWTSCVIREYVRNLSKVETSDLFVMLWINFVVLASIFCHTNCGYINNFFICDKNVLVFVGYFKWLNY